MAKPVRIKADGIVVVKVGLDNSVDARNFVAQIAHLVSYDGPDSKEIVFQIDERSLRQAAKWGLKRLIVVQRLAEYSGQTNFHKQVVRGFWLKLANSCVSGSYGKELTQLAGKKFWTKLRMVQMFWILRGFGKLINRGNLPSGMVQAMNRRSETWAELVRYAGFVPEEESPRFWRFRDWSPEKVIYEIQELHKTGLPLSPGWLKRNNYGGLITAAFKYHGSWETAIKAAGLDPYDVLKWTWKLLSRGEVVSEILNRSLQRKSLTEIRTRRDFRDLVLSAKYHFGHWREALVVAGIGPLDPSARDTVRWSREVVISTLIRLKTSGEPVYYYYLATHHQSLLGAMISYFGSWEAAIKAAGFDPEEERKHKSWGKARVLEEIRINKGAGEAINPASLDQNLMAAIYRWFGSWEAAVKASGFDPEEERLLHPRSPEQVISEITRLKERGEPLYDAYLKKHHSWLISASIFYFGSRKKALIMAGLDPEEESFHAFRRRQVINQFKSLKKQGVPINAKHLQMNHPSVYLGAKRYFGSWEAAVKASGFDPNLERRDRVWGSDKVISDIRDRKKKSLALNVRGIEEENPSLLYAMNRYFGSWEAAIKAAGLDPDKERRYRSLSRSEVVKELKALKAEGKPINPQYLVKNCGGLYSMAVRRFGSWAVAVRAAGFSPEKESLRPKTQRR